MGWVWGNKLNTIYKKRFILKEIKKQKNTYTKEEIDTDNNIIKEIEKTIYSYKFFLSHIIYFYSAMIYFLILSFPKLGLSIKTGTWIDFFLP